MWPSDADLVKVTGRVHAELDDYVATAFKATDDPNAIQARLRNVLADHRPNPEYGDLPLARVAKLGGIQSLIVAYTLVRGPHDDIATIRGYRWNLDRFELASTTGDEFLGYDMFESILRSPNSNEFWLIAWGQAHTFNGKKVRFRIYSFDGNAFRTVWSPEDVFNASLHVTDSGFVIDSEVPHSPYEIHDNYLLSLNGPVKTN